MKVVLLGTYAARQIERLRRALPGSFEISSIYDDAPREEVAIALADAAVLVTNRYGKTDPVAPKLRLLQSPSAGLEQIDPTALPTGCRLLGVDGHEQPMAEFVLCAMLDWCIGYRAETQVFQEGRWNLKHWIKGPTHEEFGGKTVGLLGYGRIGKAIATRARAFDTEVIALSRWSNGRPEGELLYSYSPEDMPQFLARCDFVVVCLPSARETTGIVGTDAFAAMKTSAVLINISRGPVVDEAALYHALETKRIAGAVLDVWYQYPTDDEILSPASQFPFHRLPNVIQTPHCSGRTDGMFERRWASVARNIANLEMEPTQS